VSKRRVLTDQFVRSVKAAPKGKRSSYPDAVVPGLVLRVTDKGSKTFAVWKRLAGKPSPSALALGSFPGMSLADAREKARTWLELIAAGYDPRLQDKRLAAEQDAEDRRETIWSDLIEDYDRYHLSHLKQGAHVKRALEYNTLPEWRDKKVRSVTRLDIVHQIEKVKNRGAKVQAHRLLSIIKSMLNWAIERGHYDLEFNAAATIRSHRLLGATKPRSRVLNDNEIKAFWAATPDLDAPYGPLLRFILLTGARRTEAAEAQWSEINFEDKTWTIPAHRYKSGTAHIVPLSAPAIALLEERPQTEKQPYIFATSRGYPAGAQFGAVMIDLREKTKADFTVHDLRRTFRTRLAQLVRRRML
jgi:integrase